jgi:hypothetical protein
MVLKKTSAEDIMMKYGARMQADISNFNLKFDSSEYSKSYLEFKESLNPNYTLYEKFANQLEELSSKTFKKRYGSNSKEYRYSSSKHY